MMYLNDHKCRELLARFDVHSSGYHDRCIVTTSEEVMPRLTRRFSEAIPWILHCGSFANSTALLDLSEPDLAVAFSPEACQMCDPRDAIFGAAAAMGWAPSFTAHSIRICAGGTFVHLVPIRYTYEASNTAPPALSAAMTALGSTASDLAQLERIMSLQEWMFDGSAQDWIKTPTFAAAGHNERLSSESDRDVIRILKLWRHALNVPLSSYTLEHVVLATKRLPGFKPQSFNLRMNQILSFMTIMWEYPIWNLNSPEIDLLRAISIEDRRRIDDAVQYGLYCDWTLALE